LAFHDIVTTTEQTASGKDVPYWRTYRSRGKLVATSIVVGVPPDMREKILARLKVIEPEKHTFSRNVARYILDHAENEIEILLIWKDTEMPDETTRERDIQHFQRDYPELDWSNAHYCNRDIYRHT
jgi:hypothetical protein